MEPSEKLLKEVRAILEKEHGRPVTDEEVMEVAWSINSLSRVLLDIAMEDGRRQKMLKDSPQGFHFDRKGYTCSICQTSASGENSWFDQYGLKCKTCQDAINREEAPPWLGQDRDAWYSIGEMGLYFNLEPVVVRRWIKKGFLQPHTMTKDGKRIHLQAFLLENHKGFLPPKDLLLGCTVKEMIDGKEWYCSRHWYQCGNPHQILKGYRIMEYIDFSLLGKEDY